MFLNHFINKRSNAANFCFASPTFQLRPRFQPLSAPEAESTPGWGCPVLTANIGGPRAPLRPPTWYGEGQCAEQSKCSWLQSSLALSHTLTSCHKSLTHAVFLAHFLRMQLELGSWLKAFLPLLTPPEHTHRRSHTAPLSLAECSHRRVTKPRTRQEQRRPCFHRFCQDPLLLDTETSPFRTCPSASSLHLLQIPGRPLELTLIVKITIRGCSESG